MSRTKRRASRSRTPAEERGRSPLRGRPTVWLATISTVVGVATGMFTLRDQVFPRESGTASAGSLPVYQAQVGRVCDELNADDQARARETRQVATKVEAARTTLTQRNALLDAQRKTIARSSHALSRFTALETPSALVVVSRSAEAAWNRNLGRLRAYALKLDQAGARPQLLAAVGYLSSQRPKLSDDGVRLMSGLRHLGGTSCDIATPHVTRTFTIPVPKSERTHASGSSAGSSSGSSADGRTGSSTGTSTHDGDGSSGPIGTADGNTGAAPGGNTGAAAGGTTGGVTGGGGGGEGGGGGGGGGGGADTADGTSPSGSTGGTTGGAGGGAVP